MRTAMRHKAGKYAKAGSRKAQLAINGDEAFLGAGTDWALAGMGEVRYLNDVTSCGGCREPPAIGVSRARSFRKRG
jgi:hypothetical protein